MPTAAAGADAGPVKPGAYCPFPKAGEAPKCLMEARDEYSGFFASVDDGRAEGEDIDQLEADVAAGAEAARAYQALSSLAYGYYQLARRAAADPSAHPALRERLERWNDLLAGAYAASPGDEPFRRAVREAAADLRRRAPAVGLRCLDARGRSARCHSTEAVLRGLDQQRDRAGVRGTVGRLVERILGSEAP